MKNILLLLLFISFSAVGQKYQKAQRVNGWSTGYLEYLPDEYRDSVSKKYPVIIFLHGLGEKGNGTTDLIKLTYQGIPKQIEAGKKIEVATDEIVNIDPCNKTAVKKVYKFIVISPQTAYTGWYVAPVKEVIDWVIKTYRVDTSMIYLTGLSMGGGGTWDYIGSDYNKPNRIAAGAILSGYGDPSSACTVSNKKILLWGFHGDKDGTIALYRGKALIDATNSCLNPVPCGNSSFTVFPGLGHSSVIWDQVYNPQGPDSTNIYKFFVKIKKK